MELSTSKKLLLGSGLRVVALVVTVLIGLLLTPFKIHTLGDELYGIWVLATSFVAMFSLLDIGLNAAVGRYAARTLGKKDYVGLNRYLNTGYYIFCGISFLSLFIAGGVAWYFFQQPEMEHATAVAIVIIILGFQFAVLLPLQAVAGLLIGALRYDIATAITIVFNIISAIVVFLTLFFGGGLVGIAIASLVCALVSRSVTVWFARREVPQAEIAVRHFDKTAVKELFSYGGLAFIISVMNTIRTKMPIFIVFAFVSVAAVTPFSIAILLSTYFSKTITAVLGILMPVFARQQANEDFKAIRKTLKFATKVSTTIAVFVAFGMIAWGGHFIERWVGEEYLVAYPWLVILVISALFVLCQKPSISLLYGLAKHYFHAITHTFSALATLVLGVILVQYYGELGVAIAILIPTVFVKTFVQPLFVCHVIKESALLYCWNILWTALVCAVALVLPSIVTYYLAAPNYPALLLTGALSAILYLPVVFVIFTKAEREHVWKALMKKQTEPQS